MEKDELGKDHLTKGLIGKKPIWQEDQVVNGQIGKGPNTTVEDEMAKDEIGEDKVVWYRF